MWRPNIGIFFNEPLPIGQARVYYNQSIDPTSRGIRARVQGFPTKYFKTELAASEYIIRCHDSRTSEEIANVCYKLSLRVEDINFNPRWN